MSDRPLDPELGEEQDLGEIEEIETDGVDETDGEQDAGGDDVDAEDEEGQGEEEDVDPPPRRGGGAKTPRDLRRRAQEAERQAADTKRELEELRQRQNAFEARQANDPQAAARAAAQEAEAVALMSPAEAAQYYYRKGQQEFNAVIQRMQAQNQDAVDRNAYEARSATSVLHQRYADRVEQVLRDERREGRSPPREVILKYLIGEDAMRRATAAAPGQRRTAARRVQSQRTRPGGARGDGARPAGARNQEDADERLLRSIGPNDV